MRGILSIILIAIGYFNLIEAIAIQSIKRLECTEEGRFADPLDCSSFYECLLDEDTNFIKAYRRTCHGFAFNYRTGTCTSPEKVKGCKTRRNRQYTVSTRFNKLCENNVNEFICGDCATQITCSDGQAYETKCENHLRCVEGLSGFMGGVCHLKYAEECRCTEPNMYYQDPYFNGTFFLCRENDSIPMFYSCPPGLYFDNTTKTCLNQDGTPSCSQKGLFAYPGDCKRYYTCTYSVEGLVQSKLTCPPGFLINEQTEACENPCNWAIKDFQCKAEGRFSNPKDCSQYFECILDLNGQLLKLMRSCPPKHHWDQSNMRCISRSKSTCKVKSEGPINQCRKDYEEICEKTLSEISEEQNEHVEEKIPSKEGSNQEKESENSEIKEEQTITVPDGSVLHSTTENTPISQSTEKEVISANHTESATEQANVTPFVSSSKIPLIEVTQDISESEAETENTPLNNGGTTESNKPITMSLISTEDQHLAITTAPLKNISESSEGIPNVELTNVSAKPEVTESENTIDTDNDIENMETEMNDKNPGSMSSISTSTTSTTEEFKDQSQDQNDLDSERVTEGSVKISSTTPSLETYDKVVEEHESQAAMETENLQLKPESTQVSESGNNAKVEESSQTQNPAHTQPTKPNEQDIRVTNKPFNESPNENILEIETDGTKNLQITTEKIQEENGNLKDSQNTEIGSEKEMNGTIPINKMSDHNVATIENPIKLQVENNQNPQSMDSSYSIFAEIKNQLQLLKKQSKIPVAMVTTTPKT